MAERDAAVSKTVLYAMRVRISPGLRMNYVIINPKTKQYWNGKRWSKKDYAQVYVGQAIKKLPEDGMWQEVKPLYPRYRTSKFEVV